MGYTPPTPEEQLQAVRHMFQNDRPLFIECGGCGSWHPAGFYGDCRNDLYRYHPEDLALGIEGVDYDMIGLPDYKRY